MTGTEPIRSEETHGIVTRPACKPFYSSGDLGWTSLAASVQSELPFQANFDPVRHHLLVFHMSRGGRVNARSDDKFVRRDVPAKGIFFWPADRGFSIGLESMVETMHLYLHREILGECLADLDDEGAKVAQCAPEMCVQDALLWEIANEISRLMQSKVEGVGLYVDTLAVAMAKRLIARQFRGQVACAHGFNPVVLSPVRLRKITEYVDANLCEQISLANLCNLVGMSQSNFVRRFNATLGQTPYQFVLGRRIESAKTFLSRTNKSLATIALDCGFSHQEHLTNVFRRRLNTTPAAFRRASGRRGF